MSRDGVCFAVQVEDVHLFNRERGIVIGTLDEPYDLLDDVSSFPGSREQKHSIRTGCERKVSGPTSQRSRGPLEFTRTIRTELAFIASASYLMSIFDSKDFGVSQPFSEV
jgi:hypothetical protein